MRGGGSIDIGADWPEAWGLWVGQSAGVRATAAHAENDFPRWLRATTRRAMSVVARRSVNTCRPSRISSPAMCALDVPPSSIVVGLPRPAIGGAHIAAEAGPALRAGLRTLSFVSARLAARPFARLRSVVGDGLLRLAALHARNIAHGENQCPRLRWPAFSKVARPTIFQPHRPENYRPVR